MITKGIVEEVYSNKLKVRVPIFETTGLNQPQYLECAICYEPGNLKGYKKGDVVYIGFEDNYINKGVVLGKLCLEEEETPSNYSLNDSLKVTGNASLPLNTTVGDIKVVDNLNKNNEEINNIKNSIGYIKKDIINSTNLYRHEIEFDLGTGGIIFIDNHKEPYLGEINQVTLSKILRNAIKVELYYNERSLDISLYNCFITGFKIIGFDNNGNTTIESLELGNIQIDSDIINEL